jgi:membrane protein
MFSLAPVLYIGLTFANLIAVRIDPLSRFLGLVEENFGAEIAGTLSVMLGDISESAASGSILGTLIGVGALLYAATGLFAQLKYALNTIWDIPPRTKSATSGFIRDRLLAFVMVMGVGLLFVLGIAANALFSWFISLLKVEQTGGIWHHLVILGLAALSFAVLYKYLPDVKVRWRHVWSGSILGAALFTLGYWAVEIYLHYFTYTSPVEAAGSLAVILIAVYYSAQIFLFGAVFSQVLATRESSNDGRVSR